MYDIKGRRENEKKYPNRDALPDGGRRYWYEIQGRYGWSARYVKEVDKEEKTVRFCQEIYDKDGRLLEVHQKYPVDLGHMPSIKGEKS